MKLFLLLVALSVPSISFAAPSQIDEVTAHVVSGASIPSRVGERMEATVAAIGTQLLAGRPIDSAKASRASDERIIHEVFDKVLVGYSVKNVSLVIDGVTTVEVELIPWADVIQNVRVDMSVEGMPPLVEGMVRRDLQSVDEVFRDSLVGLPVAASDWTNGVLKRSLNDYFASHLPEFRGDFDVVPGKDADVKLVVYPRLPVVRTVDFLMRSDSVPNIFLLGTRERLEHILRVMIGVPVKFVERHKDEFASALANDIDSTDEYRTLRLKTQMKMLRVDQDMLVMSRSDTEKYRLRIEGWADVGRSHNKDRNVKLRIHGGYNLTPEDEVFIQSDFAVKAVSWDWWLGYSRKILPMTYAVIRYDMDEKRFVLGGEQGISDRWLMRYEYRWADQKGEAAIRYKMHDFMSFEWAVDKDDNWLRVIGNF